jgi:hypothetical protein
MEPPPPINPKEMPIIKAAIKPAISILVKFSIQPLIFSKHRIRLSKLIFIIQHLEKILEL